MSTRLLEAVPVYDLPELHGKTLTISVGQDCNVECATISTVVIGTDERGHRYILVDRQENLRDVHPIER